MGGLLLLLKQHVPYECSTGNPSTKKKECSWLLVEHGIPKNSYCWLASDVNKHFFLTHKTGALPCNLPHPNSHAPTAIWDGSTGPKALETKPRGGNERIAKMLDQKPRSGA